MYLVVRQAISNPLFLSGGGGGLEPIVGITTTDSLLAALTLELGAYL